MEIVFGIDYGSKLSGNTVIAIFRENQIFFLDIDTKVDADQFIKNAVEHFKPQLVFINAPLSIPGVYKKLEGFNDYHFRKADHEVGAMSPMFLGGIAARAMHLKSWMEGQKIEVHETYPRLMAKRINLDELGYKADRNALRECAKRIGQCMRAPLSINCKDIQTWHHLEALMALMSALSFRSDDFSTYGDPKEGLIYV